MVHKQYKLPVALKDIVTQFIHGPSHTQTHVNIGVCVHKDLSFVSVRRRLSHYLI
jgi:hypothetical protein